MTSARGGLLTEGDGVANRILDALGIDPAALRTAVLDLAPPRDGA